MQAAKRSLPIYWTIEIQGLFCDLLFTKTLASLNVHPKIDPMPVEVANPIRCDIDTVHAATMAMP